ncbi:MAG TPA: sulfite exporter TauE/SafE family protein [Candidatus Acidoferrales bacterium]|nr:sulfite exporter TauE/SafE family protein [Candidatus Acidoferrales bacterium]
METALTVLLGLVASFFGSLVGFGGGFISVPALRIFGHVSPQTVAATSLFMVGVNVAVASFALRKKKRINVRMGRALGLGGVAGGFLGVFMLRFVSGGQFDVLYGLMLIFIAFNMLRPARGEQLADTEIESPRSREAGSLELGLAGAIVGFFSTLFGLGAGTVAIPMLMWRYKLPAYVAMPTASFIAVIYVWPSVFLQIAAHRVDWALAIPLSLGAVIGAHFGARYSNRLRSPQLKRVFGVICVCAFFSLTLKHLPDLLQHSAAVAATITKVAH